MFAGLAGLPHRAHGSGGWERPARTWGYLATGNYFELLGVHPAPADFSRSTTIDPARTRLAVLQLRGLAAALQSQPYGGRRDVRINRKLFTIVGVAPRDFRGTEVFYQPELWVPMARQPDIEVGNPWLENRRRRTR
jgi:hypothetical protein